MDRRHASWSGAALVYVLLAYLALPALWRHYEHQPGLQGRPMLTATSAGIPGDPINVGLVGDRAEVVSAMTKAGWQPADPITLESSIAIVGSVLLDRPYRDAPVSSLYYEGRKQDLAFEKLVGVEREAAPPRSPLGNARPGSRGKGGLAGLGDLR